MHRIHIFHADGKHTTSDQQYRLFLFSGIPGGSVKIRVRGSNSVNKNNEPLYVVDGMVRESKLDGINPEDIQSMQVLKDTSSTANLKPNAYGMLVGSQSERRNDIVNGRIDLQFNIYKGLTFTSSNGIDYLNNTNYGLGVKAVDITHSEDAEGNAFTYTTTEDLVLKEEMEVKAAWNGENSMYNIYPPVQVEKSPNLVRK